MSSERVTREQLEELAGDLRHHRISPQDFRAIREAAGLGGVPEHWSQEMFIQVRALLIATAASMKAAPLGLHTYLRQIGATEEKIHAAEAAFQALVAGREGAA